MPTPTLIALSLSSLALFVATFALVVARRTSARSLAKQLRELSERFSDLTETVESQSLQIRNLRSRANMAQAREKKANGAASSGPDAPMIDAEAEKDRWTREMNLKIATGEVRLPFRR